MNKEYDEIKDMIINTMKNEFGIKTEEMNIQGCDTLESMGIDSIKLVAIIVQLEEQLLTEINYEIDFLTEFSNITMDMLIDIILKNTERL